MPQKHWLQELHDQIERISIQLRENARKKELIGKIFHEHSALPTIPNPLREVLLEKHLINEVFPNSLNHLTVAGVDGGLVARSLIGIDIYFIRAIAVMMTFSARGIYKTEYIPEKYPKLHLYHVDVDNDDELEELGGLYRIRQELSAALEVLEKEHKHCDVLLMDGGVPELPLLLSGSPRLQNPSRWVKQLLTQLLEESFRRGIPIAWIVKDSRSKQFMDLLLKSTPFLLQNKKVPRSMMKGYRNIFATSRDQEFLYYFLPDKHRTAVFFKGEFEGSILTSEHGSRDAHHVTSPSQYHIYAFYIKSVPYDTPIRVEMAFPDTTPREKIVSQATSIAGIILTLTRSHPRYAVPSPIVEADARTKIKLNEVETILQMIQRRARVPMVQAKRRSRSPWRF